jgi:hypothetical protein
MTTFDKREESFEQKYAHDEELRFKATARRNRMLGRWAAEKLGMDGEAAENYAKELLLADFAQRDSEILAKLHRTFDAKGVTVSDHQIRRAMEEFMARALEEVKSS